jgi:hypothetical protein
MATTTTQWILELVDKISGPMKSVMSNTVVASKQVEKIGTELNGVSRKFKSVASMGGNLLGALGVGFGAFQLYEGIKSSVDEVLKLREAEAQVKAGLESTGNAAGLSMQQIQENVEKIWKASNFSKGELMDMQSLLITFPGITKNSFGAASQAVANMSTKMHQDLKSSAIQLGKALQDPILGVIALRRVGVNLNKEQSEVIKNLVENGHKAEAQQMILTELNNEFGGAAKAAYDANPMSHYKKILEEIKEKMGGFAFEIQKKLVPALTQITTVLTSAFIEVGRMLMPVISVLAKLFNLIASGNPIVWALIGAVAAYNVILGIQFGLAKLSALWNGIQLISINLLGDGFLTASVGAKIMAAAQWALNLAMDANPIGLIVAAIVALVAIVWTAINSYNKWGATLLLFLGPIGLLVNMIMALKNNWESVVKAFKDGGLLAGLKRIGIVLLDAVLYPVQQLLGLLSHIPGLGKLAGSGEAAIANVRKNLNLVTPAGSQNEKGENDKKPTLNIKGITATLTPKDLDGNTHPGGGDKQMGGTGSSKIQSITQRIDMKNYFTISHDSGKGDIDSVAEKVVRAINDKLRDGMVATAN